MAVAWGSLSKYENVIPGASDDFWDVYDTRRLECKYIGDLPLTARAFRFNFVEANELWAILSFRAFGAGGTFGSEYEVFAKSEWEILHSLGTIDEIIKHFQLSPTCCAPRVIPPMPEAPSEVPQYQSQLEQFFNNWATQLADEHMARTHPSFFQAQQRMTEAYGRLFELEHVLRRWVDQTLTQAHGPDCWDKAHITKEIKDAVSRNQADTRGAWLDDYDTSILRFAEFAALRIILFDNQHHFRSVLGTSNWFRACLSALEPQRNRIGHVNTLSGNDLQDFLRDASRIIEAIRPHVQLR